MEDANDPHGEGDFTAFPFRRPLSMLALHSNNHTCRNGLKWFEPHKPWNSSSVYLVCFGIMLTSMLIIICKFYKSERAARRCGVAGSD